METELATWQANTSLLYDFVTVYNLEWPALTCQWLECFTRPDGKRASRFLLGTYASEARDNYVYILEMEMPSEDIISMEARRFEKHNDRAGFAFGSRDDKKFKIVQRVHLPSGEVHKARQSPVPHNKVAAAITAAGETTIFSTDVPRDAAPVGRDLKDGDGSSSVRTILSGHSATSWGLSWSWFEPTQLVTSADDATICTWDFERKADTNRGGVPRVSPVRMFSTGHEAAVQVVLASRDHPAMFMSAGDDGRFLVWDTRIADNERAFFPGGKKAAGYSFNSLAQNPYRTWLIASGGSAKNGSDCDVCLWDIRTCSSPVARLQGHHDTVNAVAFCPTAEHYLASAAQDRRVTVWDLRDVGKEQPAELASDGPPELLFSHGGHPAPVQDVDWAPPDLGLYVASVCDANQLHVWRMDHSVFIRESTDEPSDDDCHRLDDFNVE